MSGLANSANAPRVAIIGGGLAGMSAAVALVANGVTVELFEARRYLGGRTGSFFDAESGEWIDHCQHVALGCCTNFFDFCHRTEIATLLKRDSTLYFFGRDGRRHVMCGSNWLPAPLHLLPALLRLRFLSLGQQLRIIRTMLRLTKTSPIDSASSPTVGEWLRQQGESARSVEDFWAVILVSALGESVEKASLPSARKVFVDGFMAANSAYEMHVPTVSLRELYHERVGNWLRERGVIFHLETPIASLRHEASNIFLKSKQETEREFSAVVMAVPWRQIGELCSPELLAEAPQLAAAAQIQSSPISGVHLWFDRPIMDVPHAVLIGRLSQWVFAKTGRNVANPSDAGCYYQVVISASSDLAGRDRDDIIREVCDDLTAVFPTVKKAKLVRARTVSDPHAVFSVRPGLDEIRPLQSTTVPGLFLAGDWTRTGWPATMEGAVRSGYLAAEGVLKSLGTPQTIIIPDLKKGRLARMVCGA